MALTRSRTSAVLLTNALAPASQAASNHVRFATGRQADDGHVRAAAADPRGRLQPRHPRHPDVDDEHVGVQRGLRGDELRAVGDGADHDKLARQEGDDAIQQCLMIVGDEHAGAATEHAL